MEVSARRAFALLKSLAFERLSGSDAEKCAAETLLAEAQGCGVDAHIEEFSVPCGRVGSARLVVTAPYQKEYAVTGYERSLSTPEGGLDADFYYAEDLLPAHLLHVKGKIVMINGRLRRADYETCVPPMRRRSCAGAPRACILKSTANAWRVPAATCAR